MKTGNIDYKLFDFHLRHHFSKLENENQAHISSALERAEEKHHKFDGIIG